MVAVTAGRRAGAGAGTGRRRAGCGGGQGQGQQQAQQQRLLAVAVAARFAEAKLASGEAAASPYGGGGGGGGGGCCVEFLECLLGALGVSPGAVAPAPAEYCWRRVSIRRRRRGGSASPRGASAEGPRAEPPGRIAGNGASATASLYTMQGKKGVNQDAMVVWETEGYCCCCFTHGDELGTSCWGWGLGERPRPPESPPRREEPPPPPLRSRRAGRSRRRRLVPWGEDAGRSRSPAGAAAAGERPPPGR